MAKSKLFEKDPQLVCENCSKDLFDDPELSIIVFLRDYNGKFVDIYTCCKGTCDEKLLKERRLPSYIDSWNDIYEFLNPLLYLKNTMAFINHLEKGTIFSENAFQTYKNVLISCAPYVMRDLNTKERKRAKDILDLPPYL